MATDFIIDRNAAPVADDARAAAIADPGFGRVFTDHMVTVRYVEGRGWHDARVTPRAPLTLDPATAVFHYAQEIFEGLKAYPVADGSTALFRADANAARFNNSARRMAMPELPPGLFVEAVRQLVAIDRRWTPAIAGGALYLRPFMFASEVFLGVKPSTEYLFVVIASAVGNYWRGGARPISLWASTHYTRAASGGTGGAKCGGNYAGSLIAQAQATANGCDQVVFLDATEHRYVEELGGMNIFFAFDDGSLLTPPLGDTILPGITRDSLMTLARDAGIAVREERYSLDQWQADAASGRLREAFACGTAAVVTAIGEVRGDFGRFAIGNGGVGATTSMLLASLTQIQRAEVPDPYGWMTRID